MAIWSGSINSNEILKDDATEALQTIEVALDSVNASDIKTYKEDLALMGFMIKEREGKEGTYDVFKDFQALFQEDSEHLDPEEFKEEYAKWYFTRKGYAIKTGSFDKKTFREAVEDGDEAKLEKLVSDRTLSILNNYRNIYVPNIVFDCLLTTPTVGGGFYEKYGFVRNTPVKKSKLNNYDPAAADGAKGSLIRNNFRAIASNLGLTLDDLTFVKSYMGEIEGIDESQLVVYGDAESIEEFRPLFSQYSPVQEEITVNGVNTGIQGWKIGGFTVVSTKFLPPKTLLFLNPDSKMLITKLISPKPEFRGIAIETIGDDEKLIGNVKGLQGAKIIIQPEGLNNTYYC